MSILVYNSFIHAAKIVSNQFYRYVLDSRCSFSRKNISSSKILLVRSRAPSFQSPFFEMKHECKPKYPWIRLQLLWRKFSASSKHFIPQDISCNIVSVSSLVISFLTDICWSHFSSGVTSSVTIIILSSSSIPSMNVTTYGCLIPIKEITANYYWFIEVSYFIVLSFCQHLCATTSLSAWDFKNLKIVYDSLSSFSSCKL